MLTVRNMARNMAFMMRAIADGREAYGVPERNKVAMTNFIRWGFNTMSSSLIWMEILNALAHAQIRLRAIEEPKCIIVG